jgi:hypothetical protein
MAKLPFKTFYLSLNDVTPLGNSLSAAADTIKSAATKVNAASKLVSDYANTVSSSFKPAFNDIDSSIIARTNTAVIKASEIQSDAIVMSTNVASVAVTSTIDLKIVAGEVKSVAVSIKDLNDYIKKIIKDAPALYLNHVRSSSLYLKEYTCYDDATSASIAVKTATDAVSNFIRYYNRGKDQTATKAIIGSSYAIILAKQSLIESSDAIPSVRDTANKVIENAISAIQKLKMCMIYYSFVTTADFANASARDSKTALDKLAYANLVKTTDEINKAKDAVDKAETSATNYVVAITKAMEVAITYISPDSIPDAINTTINAAINTANTAKTKTTEAKTAITEITTLTITSSYAAYTSAVNAANNAAKTAATDASKLSSSVIAAATDAKKNADINTANAISFATSVNTAIQTKITSDRKALSDYVTSISADLTTNVTTKVTQSFRYANSASTTIETVSNNLLITYNDFPTTISLTQQTSYSPLFSDIDLNRLYGTSSSQVTLFIPTLTDSDSMVSTVYRLPEGNIGVYHAPKLTRHTSESGKIFYGLPDSTTETANIVFGTGAFLNRSGYVKIETGTGYTKTISVYFT